MSRALLASVSWGRTFAACVLAAVALVSVSVGCTSDACDESQCAAGNRCLALNGETKCRKPCSSNADAATSCPYGYTCVAPATGALDPASNPAFCIQDNAKRADGQPLTKSPKGQWGARCNADLGLDNTDCDGEQGFQCYGISPTDGDAYCSRYGCTTDRDCGAGFWCATVNVGPSVVSTKRTIGEVETVCKRRDYCATCTADLDCPPLNGIAQHCVEGDDYVKFCSPECTSSDSCNKEAKCVDIGLEAKICYPRAGVCKGDGTLCSPCRSDADCPDGACVKGQYTTEHSCATKSPQPCDPSKKPPNYGGCPKSLESPAVGVYCLGGIFDEVPRNYCHGAYGLGGSVDIGCWTPKR